MPVNKIPVVYKFGIISPSHRLELQERLARKTKLLQARKERLLKLPKNPFEVTEEFVLAYNAAEGGKKKEKLEDRASKMIEKLKRLVGLKCGGVESHVDLPSAWTALTQLSQCKGHVQQECLDILLVSLDQSPTSQDQILVLFFLAESVLYVLRTDVIYEQFLGSAEVRLLLIGQKVFARLFYHHMCGHMTDNCNDMKKRLHDYLDGFLDSQNVYRPYPHLLFCVRYIAAVGSIVIGDVVDVTTATATTAAVTTPTDTTATVTLSKRQQRMAPVERTLTSTSAAISSSVHELAPTLWHSLDIWRCVCQLGGGLPQALGTMMECAVYLAMESWVDVFCALEILCDAACTNLSTLTTLQHIVCGIHEMVSNSDQIGFESRVDAMMTSQHRPRLPAIIESDVSLHSWNKSQGHSMTLVEGTKSGRSFAGDTSMENASMVGNLSSGEYVSPEFGSDESLLSNQASTTASSGLPSWRWELAVKYVDVLTHIALCGSTTWIRRRALMGNNESIDYIQQMASIVRWPLISAGLFDLLFFQTATYDSENSGPSDWAWRVRFVTLLSLQKIHVCLSKDKSTIGARAVIWKVLEKSKQWERDLRVLEALKVAQVDANLEILLQSHLASKPSNLGSRIAHGLSSLYLPSLPPLSGRTQTPTEPPHVVWSKSDTFGKFSGSSQRKRFPLRTSVREEILLSSVLSQPSISYEKRSELKLQHMVEDQWRKVLEREIEEQRETTLQEFAESKKQTSNS